MKITVDFDPQDVSVELAISLMSASEHCLDCENALFYDKAKRHGIQKRTTRNGNVIYEVFKNKLKEQQEKSDDQN